jgi:hypothetical protein
METTFLRSYAFVLACAGGLSISSACVGQTLTVSPSYPLFCQGPLHTSDQRTHFQWSKKGAGTEAPAPGQCAWADRGPRGSEIKDGFGNTLDGELDVCNGDFANLSAGKYIELGVHNNQTELSIYSVYGYVKPPFSSSPTLPQTPACATPTPK